MTASAHKKAAPIPAEPYGLYALGKTAIHRIRREVRTAIKQGRLVKPSHCSKCGSPDKPGKDGRSTIHAHHHNGYDDPLDVEWLCASCHRRDTHHRHYGNRPQKGFLNYNARLSRSQVEEIRKSDRPAKHLARELGVGATTIRDIRKGRTWADV